MPTDQEIGRHAEELAAFFLCENSYVILARNLRFPCGEIDILVQDADGTIVIVEVKASEHSHAERSPIDRITPQKQRKLMQLAYQVAARYPDTNIRIDAVSLYWQGGEPQISHFLNIIPHISLT